jgi:MATE family multidrug resistance protein
LGIAAAMGLALGGAMYVGSWALARAYTPDVAVAAIAAQLLALVAAYHLADSVQAVMIQVLRAYKQTWGPTLIYAVSLWGVGLGGGYLLGLTDVFGAARGAAGFWLAATLSLAVASVLTTLYFLRIAKAGAKH